MKLLESTERKKSTTKNGENLSQIEITKAVLLHCNIFNSQCQHDSRVSCTFVSNKSYGQLLNISPTN